MQLTKVVPFLVEGELMRLGAIFEKLADWRPLSIANGCLITRQNSASSTSAAQALMKLLGERPDHSVARVDDHIGSSLLPMTMAQGDFALLAAKSNATVERRSHSELRSIVDRTICAATMEGGTYVK